MKLITIERGSYNELRKVLMIMKLTLLFLTTTICCWATTSSYAQTAEISLSAGNKTLKEIFKEIEDKSEFIFFYNDNAVDLTKKVNVSNHKGTIEEILEEVLAGTTTAKYTIIDRQIIFYKPKEVAAATPKIEQQSNKIPIKGKVVDSQGESLIGANIVEKGTTNGTVTDIDGNFILSVTPNSTLEISYIGFIPVTVPVGNQTTFHIKIHEDTQSLTEVVVVGYGTQKKQTVTGAIASIQTKDLIQSPQANVSNMLSGRLPGLLAVQRSGEPGNDQSTLRIRGIGTFAGGEGSQDPLIMVDGIETANYNNIDPNEIESLSILKDASATAVYGVRGANGVILITTKRGVEGTPQLSYTGSVSMNRFTELREPMNAYDFVTNNNKALMYDSYISGGYTPRFSDEEIEMYRTGADPIFYPDVDWYDMMLKPYSINTQHNFNVSGGVKRVKYFVSAGYLNQEGQMKEHSVMDGFEGQSKYERFNFRSNFDFQVTDKFTIKLNVASQFENRKGTGAAPGIIMQRIGCINPISTPGLIDNKLVELNNSVNNPLKAFLNSGFQQDYRNFLNGSLRLDYNLDVLTKGLSAHATLSYENYYRHKQQYKKTVVTYRVRRDDNNELTFEPLAEDAEYIHTSEWDKNRRTYFEFGLNYNRTFGNHTVTGLLLYNQTKVVNPNLAYKIPSGYQGLVGRVAYDYKNRYMAEFNAGYNGTENFAEGNRFGFFPAVSVGWTVSEESFFPEQPIMTYLKFRGSYGEVGNDKIGSARFLYLPTTYTYGGGSYYFGMVGSSYNTTTLANEGKLGNPLLTWERAKKKDIGVEMSFWDNKIRVSADIFSEVRDDILTNPNTTPAIFGATMPAYNMGEMENKGWDGEIIFRDRFKEIDYWIRGNYTYAKNTIKYQDEIPNSNPYLYRTGQSVGQYFGLICDGIYNTWEEVNDAKRPVSSWQNNKIQPGDLKYRDINGDGIIDSNDQVPIGYSNFPEVVYGISFGGSWKGIDISVLFQGASNVSLHVSELYRNGFGGDFGAAEYLKESWSYERYTNGQSIKLPHLSDGSLQKHNYQPSNIWIKDASYIRLKNVEIGYNFRNEWIKRLGMSSVRIYMNGSNLYTWHSLFKGIDPEAAQQASGNEPYPVTSVYNLGVNVKF